MADLSSYDVAYLRGMIEHHRTALKMSRDYLQSPAGQRLAKVTALANAVITAQTAEIAKMQQWLKDAPSSAAGGGMKM